MCRTAILLSNKSKRPLITMATLEILLRLIRRNPSPSNALERSEYARRDRDLLWYLFRGTVWTGYTRQVK